MKGGIQMLPLANNDLYAEMVSRSFQQDLEEKFEQELLPIVIRIQLKDAYPFFTNENIAKEISDFQYLFLKARQCNNVGHDYTFDGSDIGPESGSESFSCSRCGKGHNIIYY
jgi:hypothetical protein